ncbi:MAG: alginate export family protein [Candidatus Omnitrophota bacterium]
MKHFKALFVVALVVTFAVPAYAETQNVKVSGSIDMYHFYRSNWDLRDNNDAGAQPGFGSFSFFTVPGVDHGSTSISRSEGDDYFRTNTQIEVSADLTDNVSTVINIVNQRDWNAGTDDFTDAAPSDGEEFDIELDLAYVQMKEIFYSPLTLTFGRQDLWFGRGLVIGSNWRAWDHEATPTFGTGQVQADEYSVTTAFDAIRATLDFNPWTLDFVYSKIDENAHDPEDDIDLYVVNVNYKFSEYNAVAELYYAGEIDRGTFPTFNFTEEDGATHDNDTHTIGGRVQFDPISQITLGGELAYQFGDYRSPFDFFGGPPTAEFHEERDREAWMLNLFGTYRWDYEWKPEITIEYLHFSGEEDPAHSGTSEDYNAWNRLYRGKFLTAYADYREFVYGTGDPVDQAAGQNENLFQVRGSMRPLEDLLIEASWTYLWTDEDVDNEFLASFESSFQSGNQRDEELGWEVDLGATYDYTEDVSFSVLAAWFVPGDFFDGDTTFDGVPVSTETAPEASVFKIADDTAFEVVSSVKVTF